MVIPSTLNSLGTFKPDYMHELGYANQVETSDRD